MLYSQGSKDLQIRFSNIIITHLHFNVHQVSYNNQTISSMQIRLIFKAISNTFLYFQKKMYNNKMKTRIFNSTMYMYECSI